jgi:transposase
LYQRYLDEKEVARKQKAQFFWLVRSGKTIRESSQIAGLQERVGQRYMSWYRSEGIDAAINRKHGGDNGNRAAWLNAEQMEQLKGHANAGNLKTVWEGIEWAKQKFDKKYSYEGMRSVYKRLKLNKKVPRKQHIKSDPVAQEAWKKGVWLTD